MLRNQAKCISNGWYLVSLESKLKREVSRFGKQEGYSRERWSNSNCHTSSLQNHPPVTFTASQTTCFTYNSICCYIPPYLQCDRCGWIKQPLSWVSAQLMEPCEEASLWGWLY